MGRPPTSGYCHTCRKRRIKCDKTRPACQRCLKSGYTCKGYDLGLRMQSLVVITEPKGSQRLAKISPPSKPSQHEQRVGRELSLVAFQEQIAFSYFFATYGWASFWKPFLELAQESDLSTTSHTCSLALAYGHMGLGHSEKSLQSMGLELYGRSLREVQSLLTHGVGTKTDLARLTVPVVILGMYSYAVDKDLRLVHHLGVAQILQHCGPESFQEEPLLTSFRSCRALLICQSFGLRRRTFVEEEQWKTVPWQKLPKTPLDKLLDILADVPGIVHDMAASEQPIAPTSRHTFQLKVKKLVAQLRKWRWEWDVTHPNAAREVQSRLSLQGVETPVFRELLSRSLEFDSVTQALDMLTYNAGLVYLMQLEDILSIGEPKSSQLSDEDMEYIKHATDRHPESPLLQPGEARFLCQPALEAFRLVPFLYDNLMTSKERVMVILAPIGIVYCSLQAHPELNRCMESVLADIPFFRDASRELKVYEIPTATGQLWMAPVVA